MGLLLTLMLVGIPMADGGEVIAVEADGGEVPIVAPALTPTLAPLLAPELVPDGGSRTMLTPSTLSVYSVDLPAEIAITVGSVGLAAIVDLLVKPTLEGDISCRQGVGDNRCNPADLSSFDRYAVGRKSTEWTIFSDVALYSSVLIPALYLGLESLVLPTTEPWGDWARDLLVVSEAMAFTAMFQVFFKFAFRRPRPARYLDAPTPGTFDQELSFPSGHTSMVAAATTALTTTIFFRHPQSKVRYVVLGAGILLTSLTALARVEGGHHFPTDVLIGMMVGGFGGFVIPWLHKKEAPVVPTAMFDPSRGSGMFGLAGSF